jgi:hypothetical protein
MSLTDSVIHIKFADSEFGLQADYLLLNRRNPPGSKRESGGFRCL